MQFVSIDGQVHDAQTRKALAMVRIEVTHQGIPSAMAYTNADGRFRMSVLPGSYTISAESNGYDSKSVEIDSTMPGPIDVELIRKRLVRQDVAALNDRGNRYRRLGLLEKAETCFKEAFKQSDSVYVALNLSELYTA